MKSYCKEKARAQREKKAADKGLVSVRKLPTGIVANSSADYRKQYKRLIRERAGKVAKTRDEIASEAKAKRDNEDAKREALRQRRQVCDAHVKRFVQVMRDRKKYAIRYAKNPAAEIERTSLAKQQLADFYVVQQLKSFGIPRNAITPALIQLKREAMEARRLAINIKRAIKNHWKEEHETITKHT